MKVVVITGNPRKNGTSSLLADRFVEGASECKHKIFRFDAAHETVKHCTGCELCGFGTSKCVLHDAMEKLYPKILEADVMVFVTPLYFWGMSAQIKMVIDRLCSVSSQMKENSKRAILMATAYDTAESSMDALVFHYTTMVSYLKWQNAGILLAPGCGKRSDIEGTEYSDKAYQMGKSI